MKPFYQSKTVIFNFLMTIIMAVPIIASAYGKLQPEAAVLADSIAGLIVGLGNIVLRVWFTDTPIDNAKMRATWAIDERLDAIVPAPEQQ